MTNDQQVKLGSLVRDVVTGMEGIVVSYTAYLNGCLRYAVQPPVTEDGKVPDQEWVDEQQAEYLGAGVEHLALRATVASTAAELVSADPPRAKTGGPAKMPRERTPRDRSTA